MVLIIKNKNLYLLSTCVFLIGITISMSSVMAWPQATIEKPTYAYELGGYRVSGQDVDLQTNNGVAVHWKGEDVSKWWDIWTWFWYIEPAIVFDLPGGSYETVFLQIDFKYSGDKTLDIWVFYSTGGSDHFSEPPTGGSYRTKTFYLDSYKKVTYVTLWACDWKPAGGFQQHIYVDYICIGYNNFY